MADITTNYLGMGLKSPLIISSSGLTNSPEKILKYEQYGAGAVVLKSLFEEQINYDSGRLVEDGLSPEAHDYITGYSKANSVEEYLKLIEKAKKTVSIPVIASINCMSLRDWVSYARNIESAGADALELNVFFLASDSGQSSESIENLYNDILIKVRSITKFPIAVKMSSHFTNLVHTVNNLYVRGASGVVLFNRFYEPDIDVNKLEITSSAVFSKPADIRQSLRWIGIISDKVEKIHIAASGGVHDGEAAIKQILAGAKAVQVCSVIYEKGAEYIKQINSEISSWMDSKGFSSIEQFRGKLNYKNNGNPALYERSQFMKYFSEHQ
ncbi:MAG TPA: dihydroorotate dehydrogenase-like protein [Bacteroidales bacterium]|nr:dihydroorotate dehydrogenase-like protein [Bacteroidales bacterium]